MKAIELIKKLAKLDPNAPVFIDISGSMFHIKDVTKSELTSLEKLVQTPNIIIKGVKNL